MVSHDLTMASEPNKNPNSMWNTKSPNPVPDPLVGWTVLILSDGVRRFQRIIGHRMMGPTISSSSPRPSSSSPEQFCKILPSNLDQWPTL